MVKSTVIRDERNMSYNSCKVVSWSTHDTEDRAIFEKQPGCHRIP